MRSASRCRVSTGSNESTICRVSAGGRVWSSLCKHRRLAMGNVSPESALHAIIFITSALFIVPVRGECLFEKHFGRRLSEPTMAGVVRHVRSPAQCERLCLDYSAECAAANVICFRFNVCNCEIFAELPTNFVTDQLLSNPGGVFIQRLG